MADAFYLLYTYNNEGNTGFYLYDVVEGSFQRYFSLQETAVVTEQMGQKQILIIGTLAFLLVCAIVVIINLILHNRDLKLDMEEGTLYRDDTEEEKKEDGKQPKKQTAKKAEEKPAKQTAKKAEEKPAAAKKPAAEKPVKQTAKKAEEKTVKPTAKKEPVVKKEVTPNGVTYTTGQIPITVVQPPKPAKRSQVPIYTLEREPVPLTREAPADQLDDDFEFEFIDIDS